MAVQSGRNLQPFMGFQANQHSAGGFRLMSDRYFSEDRLGLARFAASEALREYVVLGDMESAGKCYYMLSQISRLERDYDTAFLDITFAKQAFLLVHNKRSHASCVWTSAVLHACVCHFDEAEQLFQDAKEEFEGCSDHEGVMDCETNMGEIAQIQGRNGAALYHFSNAGREAAELGARGYKRREELAAKVASVMSSA